MTVPFVYGRLSGTTSEVLLVGPRQHPSGPVQPRHLPGPWRLTALVQRARRARGTAS